MEMMVKHTYDVSGFPKEVCLRDGTRIVLKPMTPDDAGALLDFFRGIPAEDRFYLKEDVTSRKVVERWVQVRLRHVLGHGRSGQKDHHSSHFPRGSSKNTRSRGRPSMSLAKLRKVPTWK